MNNIILAICLTLISFSAVAGAELESFKTDVAAYLQEQGKTPNHIINYTDPNGDVARLILNPSRIDRIAAELSGEIHQEDSAKVLADLYKPVAVNYETAFKEVPGKYEAEYLDMIDSSYRLLMATIRPIQSMDISRIRDKNAREMLVGLQKMMNSISVLMLNSFEQQIKANKFSPEFTPIAKSRLESLRRLQASMNLSTNEPPPLTLSSIQNKFQPIKGIPDAFETISTDDSESYVFAQSCLATIDAASFNEAVSKTKEKNIHTAITGGTVYPYLIFSDGQAYCIHMSENMHPILAIEAFRNTVSFTGLLEGEKNLWADVATQIAKNGTAEILVVDRSGNGTQISFSLLKAQPINLDYHVNQNNLKKGSFKESDFASVYHIVGNIKVSFYGSSEETKKFICAH